MTNNSSEAHPGNLPWEGALKTKINGCKNLRKIGASVLILIWQGYWICLWSLLARKKITFGRFFKSTFLFLKRNWDCLLFPKGKKTIYNNYKCCIGKQYMNKAIRKGSTWERTKKVIPKLRFTFIISCILIAICQQGNYF